MIAARPASAQKQVAFIRNMYANMVNVPAVLTTYLHGYNAFRQYSGFSPTTGAAFLAAGYSELQAMNVVLAAAVKTLSNYTNHLFDTVVDDRFAAYRVA
jgi:hypothetical protein